MPFHVWGSHHAKFDDDVNSFRGIACKAHTHTCTPHTHTLPLQNNHPTCNISQTQVVYGNIFKSAYDLIASKKKSTTQGHFKDSHLFQLHPGRFTNASQSDSLSKCVHNSSTTTRARKPSCGVLVCRTCSRCGTWRRTPGKWWPVCVNSPPALAATSPCSTLWRSSKVRLLLLLSALCFLGLYFCFHRRVCFLYRKGMMCFVL